jgi:two-component system, sensor histidine kinase and response regulator
MKPNPSDPTTGNILIIDDTPDNLRFLSDLLTKAGYTVRKVINGELGIESALLEPPDLILLDIRMPILNGYEVCDRLKSNERTSQIPVIFLSGLDEEVEKVMAFQAGGVDYILKPFDVVEVLARIETHLRISRLQQQLQQKNLQLEQEIEQRSSAEAALKILDQGLEARIRERTADLQTKNEQLINLQTKLRDALIQEQKRSELKSQWINTIAERFQTPMMVTRSALELLKQEQQLQTDDVARYLHMIEDGTQEMHQALQDVLLLMDGDAQKLAFDPKPLNLTQFCRSLTQQWPLPTSPAYKLLFIDFGKSPETVLGDERLLQQICSHLLANAVRYSPNGGSILFELVYEPTQVLIQIRDEGIGIPPEDQERIFDRFYRAKNAAFAGNSPGLGLAVVKRAVEQYGGSITVSSKVNQGSIFTVTLPLLPPDSTRDSAPDSAAHSAPNFMLDSAPDSTLSP